jgi:acetoacetate decarboxylase
MNIADVSREFLIISYRTDPKALRAVVPEPLQIGEPIVMLKIIPHVDGPPASASWCATSWKT